MSKHLHTGPLYSPTALNLRGGRLYESNSVRRTAEACLPGPPSVGTIRYGPTLRAHEVGHAPRARLEPRPVEFVALVDPPDARIPTGCGIVDDHVPCFGEAPDHEQVAR